MKKQKNMDVEWHYSGNLGPEHWHELCDWFNEAAQFPLQSPIALNTTEAKFHKETGYVPLEIHYQKETFTEKEFKNTFHFVPFDMKSYIVFKGEEYYLTDIHFHMPSEHFINQQQSALEFHLVHMNKSGENLVLGVLFEISETQGILADYKKEQTWDFSRHQQRFNPAIFLPKEATHFYYVGSLTTPPTAGPINWFVFDTVQLIHRQFIDFVTAPLQEKNNRPLQARLDREIIYYGEEFE